MVSLPTKTVQSTPERPSALVGALPIRERTAARLFTEYTVGPDEPVLAGHFPGFPIFPGVCLLECAYRTAELALVDVTEAEPTGPRLASIESVRFLRPVFSGDVVRSEVTVTPLDGGWRCQVEQSALPAGAQERAAVAVFRLRYAPAVRHPAAPGEPAGAGENGRSTDPGPEADPTTESPVGAAPTALDVGDIKRLLPHRYPMLLVDRVHQVVPGAALTGTKTVTVNEPCYAGLGDEAGHEYPPALLVESWCQAAGVLACLDQPNPDVLRGRVTLFGSITRLDLPTPVLPGDSVRHHVRMLRSLSDAAVLEGESRVDGRTVLRVASVVIALRPAGTLGSATGWGVRS